MHKKKERERKIIRREIYKKKREEKKRERKKERVREPWLHTLKQLTHTKIKRLLLFLTKRLLLHSD